MENLRLEKKQFYISYVSFASKKVSCFSGGEFLHSFSPRIVQLIMLYIYLISITYNKSENLIGEKFEVNFRLLFIFNTRNFYSTF